MFHVSEANRMVAALLVRGHVSALFRGVQEERSMTEEEARREREADRRRVEQERRKLESEVKKEQGRENGS